MRRLKEIRKVQELVFELKVGTAKERKVVTLSPDTMMSEVRAVLKSHKIAAAPVIVQSTLVGIISVNDYINWLTKREPDCPVSKQMSRDVKFLYEDEPLVDAIKSFEKYGFYEFPVINRKTGKFMGIITRRDIIVGLLRALEIDYLKMEISSYTGHHFFNDMTADEISLVFEYKVPGKEIQHGGEVASKLKKNLSYLGIHPDIIRRVAISTYEAEMNLIIYGEGGEITVNLDNKTIKINVKDEGPGIPDIQKALQAGYSTAPDWVRELGFGAGMGFTNIQNCAESFDIFSTTGKGTTLHIIIPLEKNDYKIKSSNTAE